MGSKNGPSKAEKKYRYCLREQFDIFPMMLCTTVYEENLVIFLDLSATLI